MIEPQPTRPQSLHPKIKNAQGMTWAEYRKTLKPNYFAVWLHMLFPWIMIALCFSVFVLFAQFLPPWVSYVAALPLALWSAFWLQAYTPYFHEAAHFNIAANRDINDLLANVLLTPFLGLSIKSFRATHWEHHRSLGTVDDTEISYYRALTFRRILWVLSGLYIVETLVRYLRNFSKSSNKTERKTTDVSNKKVKSFLAALSYLAIMQLLIMAALFYFISLAASISWFIAFFVFSPLLSNIRQTLEHRSLEAQKDVDYQKTPHGTTNRIFGNSFFARFFGAAGFNRHLLHHWDPTLSYTRFKEMEKFLHDSELSDEVKSNTTTYWKTWKKLISWK